MPEPATPPASDAAPPSKGRALLGAAVGAAVGAGIWAAMASFTGLWTGFCALVVGALAAGGARRLGGKGTTVAAGAAALALVGSFVGQGFTARRQVEERVRGTLTTVDRAHYDAFAAAAADWNPKMRGDEVSKFAYAHEFVDMTNMGGIQARIAEFRRTTVPELEAWKRKAPTFEEWQTQRREEILGGADPWREYLGSPMEFTSPLDLLFWLLGAAAAARLAYVREPPTLVRRRAGKPAAEGTSPQG